MLNVYTFLILRISLVFISVVPISPKKRGSRPSGMEWDGRWEGGSRERGICILMVDSCC